MLPRFESFVQERKYLKNVRNWADLVTADLRPCMSA